MRVYVYCKGNCMAEACMDSSNSNPENENEYVSHSQNYIKSNEFRRSGSDVAVAIIKF